MEKLYGQILKHILELDAVKEEISKIRPSLPDNIEMKVGYDQSIFVKESINQVRIAGRTTQGVSIFKIPDGDKIVSVSRLTELNN